MIYTVGHSTLDQGSFNELVKPLDLLVDIRSHPGSAKYPHFNKDEMESWLEIPYTWEPGLGGWTEKHVGLQDQFPGVDIEIYGRRKFPKQRIAAKLEPGEKPAWTNQGLWDYQWFMTLPEFLDAAEWLVRRGSEQNVGIMCAEVLPWKCHRMMVADYLLYQGIDCQHLQPKPKMHSEMIGNRLERYEDAVKRCWK